MATPAEALATVPVVLLGRDDALRAQLRSALVECGAAIVHEGDIAGADCAELVAMKPGVVLVNLEPGIEDALDALDPLLMEPSINVVFNEGEASGQLSGWDLSRWARHLAAKVMGHSDTVPPPPAGAESLPPRDLLPRPGAPPTPAQEVGDISLDGFAAEAASNETAVPSSPDLAAIAVDRSDAAPLDLVAAEPAVDDDTTIEISVERELHGADASVDADAFEVAVAVDRELHGGATAAEDFELDIGEISASLSQLDAPVPVAEPRAQAAPADAIDESALELSDVADIDIGDADLEFDFDAAFDAGATAAPTSSLDVNETSELGLDLDFELPEGGPLPTMADDAELDLGADADVAALAAQLEALAADGARDEEAGIAAEPDFDFSVASTDAGPIAADADTVAAAATAAGLALAPMDSAQPQARPEPAPAQVPADPARATIASSGTGFGELSLAPVDDEAAAMPAAAPAAAPAAGFDFSNLSLSLEPMEGEGSDDATAAADAHPGEAVAPIAALDGPGFDEVAPQGAGAAQLASVDADSGVAIPRVIVLGASIGGPDALRTFLAHLPADFPALLLLCQHLDNGFFSRLAQQLQKVSKLPIRVAEPGAEPARRGEVVVVPSSHRFVFADDGAIDALDHATPPHYKPCIDDLMRDVADRFGARATAIIFSGMAGDAVEGAVHVTARGGEVWAQDPDSCVVSSMVDGARARGVVEFVGSPRDLAEQCIKRYGRPQ